MKKHKLIGQTIPDCLGAIPDPPKQLYVMGELNALLSQPRVGIVGSRKVTTYGTAVTQQLAGALSKAGVVIISGLALGVDGLAHQAAVEQGGPTIAVLPCGLDHIYPRTHAQLAERILQQGGAVVTEYPEGTEPYPANFLARNRLIAGLSDVLVITEAAQRSGSLSTANHALNQGKEVFAVPGNITSPQSAGTNNLIKSGATPVTEANDILSVLDLTQAITSSALPATEQEAIILKLIKQGVSDGSQLLSKSKLEPAIFNQTLTMLEITGKIKPLSNNHWSL